MSIWQSKGLLIYCGCVAFALGAVFGCPFGDATPLEKTLAYARRAMELGASSLGLGDSAGMADPIHTERILRGILERFRPEQISLHIHNTEGFGLANCVKAMELGFTRFDVSLAGMGGWMDLITIYVSPFGAMLVAVCLYFVLGPGAVKDELALGGKRPGRMFDFVARAYVLVAAAVWVLGICYHGIG